MDRPSSQPPRFEPAAASPVPLRVLIVEDSEADAGLLVRELQQQGYEPSWQRVANAAELEAALAQTVWDLVLSDYALPGFGGMEALQIVQTSGRDLPFILVSGTIGEDVAVAAMRAGAHDYLLKERLARLGAAVRRAIDEAEQRRGRRQAEAAARAADEELRRMLAAAERGRRSIPRILSPGWRTAKRTAMLADEPE